MTWLRSICFLWAVILIGIAITVFVEAIPAPSSKKSEIEKNKSNTRHDRVNSGIDCQYSKGIWSECSASTNIKTRTLTLKKGQDETKCEKFKTIEKKCKKPKGCKYDKGTWSKCNSNNEMSRTDMLRNPNESDVSCEKTKLITKTCKSKTDRNNKGQQKHKQQESRINKKLENSSTI